MNSAPFWRNVSIVLLGSIAAQALPILILPILSRTVPADALGSYFVWFGAASILSVLAGSKLEVAIFGAHTDREVNNLLYTVIALSCLVGCAGLVFLSGFEAVSGRQLLSGKTDEFRLAWAAIAVVSTLNQVALAVLVYRARFKRLAFVKVLLAGSISLAQLSASLLEPSTRGLVYGHLFAATGVAAFLLIALTRRSELGFHPPTPRTILSTLRRNYRFPVFAMPADFINVSAAQLPLFLIATRFGTEASAAYGLTLRVLAAPLGLIAGSILTVYKERAARDYREFGNCSEAFMSSAKALALLAIAPCTILFFFGEPLLVLLLGKQWSSAGRMGETLAPLFMLKFVASPLSYTLYIANRQAGDLVWQLGLLAMTWLTFTYSSTLEASIAVYSAGYTAMYVVYLAMSYRAAQGDAA